MYFKSKNFSLLVLGVTAIVCSRAMFFFIDDPEGPNLLVVAVMTAIIYVPSLAVYLSDFLTKMLGKGLKRLMLVIAAQIVVTTIFYVCLS